jgi:ABC-type multidrug transport system ATPase subunit
MLCDRVGIVLGGQLRRTATVNDLVAAQQHRVEIRCVGAPLIEVPARWNEIVERFELPEGTTFVLHDAIHVNEVLGWLLGAGVKVRAVTPQRPTLEDFFLSVAGSLSDATDAGSGKRTA